MKKIHHLSFFFLILLFCAFVVNSLMPLSAYAQPSVAFIPPNETWENLKPPVPDTGYIKSITVTYYCFSPSELVSIAFSDAVHFKLAQNSNGDTITKFPISISPGTGTFIVYVSFFPGGTPDSSYGLWTAQPVNSHDEIFSQDTLRGAGPVAAVSPASSEDTAEVIALSDGNSIKIMTGNEIAPLNFQLFDLLGIPVYSGTISGAGTVRLGALPKGIYFYRLSGSHSKTTGKLMLGN